MTVVIIAIGVFALCFKVLNKRPRVNRTLSLQSPRAHYLNVHTRQGEWRD